MYNCLKQKQRRTFKHLLLLLTQKLQTEKTRDYNKVSIVKCNQIVILFLKVLMI